jgi:phage terminase large subunit-like protein
MASQPTRPRRSSTDPVTAYAKAVASGKKIAGPHVRDACQRHMDDMLHGAARGLTFDRTAAERAIDFFSVVLRLNGGEFEGQPFLLLDWQKFIVGSLFGWKGPDGWRRFRVAYVETAKGSGKSPLAAGIGMYGLVADGEARAEIYAAATKKDQAMVLFRDAVAMFNQSPALKARLKSSGTGENVYNLAYLEKGSFFRAISADDGQNGPRPHMSLVDEIHEHRNNTVIEMQRAGTKSRRQALIFMITNSGANKTGPCWQYHEYAGKVSSGMLKDDAFFGYVCALDEGDDPFRNEKCWAKANPSLQGANLPGMKYLREQVTEARGMPGKEALVRRLNFNQWTDALNPWISSDVWLGAQLEYDWHTLRGRRAWAGFDLGSTTDLTGLVLYVEPSEVGEPWKLVPFAWLPDEGLDRKEDVDRVPYLAWRAAGYLETTPGRAVSRLHLVRRLAELAEQFDLQAVAVDRWRLEDVKSMAEDAGVTLPNMVPFGQGYKDMSPAIEAFETALLNREVAHPGHPVFTWCAANAVTVSDDAENRKLSKEKATGRIDLIVAAVMAVGAAQSEEAAGNIDDFINSPVWG